MIRLTAAVAVVLAAAYVALTLQLVPFSLGGSAART